MKVSISLPWLSAIPSDDFVESTIVNEMWELSSCTKWQQTNT